MLGTVPRRRRPSPRLLQTAEKEHPRPGKRTADAQPQKRGVRTEAFLYSNSEPAAGTAGPTPPPDNNAEKPSSLRRSEGLRQRGVLVGLVLAHRRRPGEFDGFGVGTPTVRPLGSADAPSDAITRAAPRELPSLGTLRTSGSAAAAGSSV